MYDKINKKQKRIYLSIYLSVYLSVCLSIHLSLYLSIYSIYGLILYHPFPLSTTSQMHTVHSVPTNIDLASGDYSWGHAVGGMAPAMAPSPDL
jgi:hypothetical protein